MSLSWKLVGLLVDIMQNAEYIKTMIKQSEVMYTFAPFTNSLNLWVEVQNNIANSAECVCNNCLRKGGNKIALVTSPRERCEVLRSTSVGLCVCLSVCPFAYLKNTCTNFTKFSVHVNICGHGSVLLRRQCNTLCTSGFVDDVTFSYRLIQTSLRRRKI